MIFAREKSCLDESHFTQHMKGTEEIPHNGVTINASFSLIDAHIGVLLMYVKDVSALGCSFRRPRHWLGSGNTKMPTPLLTIFAL